MKYCTHCGSEVNDEAIVCIHCGRALENEAAKKSNDNSTMKTIIYVFLILSCIAWAFALLPLAWCIPITLSIKKKLDNNEPIGVGLKVCTLLFVSLIAGILLLCLDE